MPPLILALGFLHALYSAIIVQLAVNSVVPIQVSLTGIFSLSPKLSSTLSLVISYQAKLYSFLSSPTTVWNLISQMYENAANHSPPSCQFIII